MLTLVLSPIGPFWCPLTYESFMSLKKCALGMQNTRTADQMPVLGRKKAVELWSSWLSHTLVRNVRAVRTTCVCYEKQCKVQAAENPCARRAGDGQPGCAPQHIVIVYGGRSSSLELGDDRGRSVFILCLLQTFSLSLSFSLCFITWNPV